MDDPAVRRVPYRGRGQPVFIVTEPVDLTQARQAIALPAERFPVVTPLAPSRFELRCTISQEAHDAIRAAKELLGHVLPGADASRIVEKALIELVARLEKQKYAEVETPRESRMRVEFDHIRPVCFGGKSSAANLRLRCQVHNQYEAIHLFGEEFMAHKRGKRAWPE